MNRKSKISVSSAYFLLLLLTSVMIVLFSKNAITLMKYTNPRSMSTLKPDNIKYGDFVKLEINYEYVMSNIADISYYIDYVSTNPFGISIYIPINGNIYTYSTSENDDSIRQIYTNPNYKYEAICKVGTPQAVHHHINDKLAPGDKVYYWIDFHEAKPRWVYIKNTLATFLMTLFFVIFLYKIRSTLGNLFYKVTPRLKVTEKDIAYDPILEKQKTYIRLEGYYKNREKLRKRAFFSVWLIAIYVTVLLVNYFVFQGHTWTISAFFYSFWGDILKVILLMNALIGAVQIIIYAINGGNRNATLWAQSQGYCPLSETIEGEEERLRFIEQYISSDLAAAQRKHMIR